MIFVDSNIWCYYFDKRVPEHEQVRELMRKIVSSEEIVCNTIVILEVAHYLTRHFEETTGRTKIEHFVNLSNLTILDFDRQSMNQALESPIEDCNADGVGGRDATVIATMKAKKLKQSYRMTRSSSDYLQNLTSR